MAKGHCHRVCPSTGGYVWSQFKAGINLPSFLIFEPHPTSQIELCKVKHRRSNGGRPRVKPEMLVPGHHAGARATISWGTAQDMTAPLFCCNLLLLSSKLCPRCSFTTGRHVGFVAGSCTPLTMQFCSTAFPTSKMQEIRKRYSSCCRMA